MYYSYNMWKEGWAEEAKRFKKFCSALDRPIESLETAELIDDIHEYYPGAYPALGWLSNMQPRKEVNRKVGDRDLADLAEKCIRKRRLLVWQSLDVSHYPEKIVEYLESRFLHVHISGEAIRIASTMLDLDMVWGGGDKQAFFRLSQKSIDRERIICESGDLEWDPIVEIELSNLENLIKTRFPKMVIRSQA